MPYSFGHKATLPPVTGAQQSSTTQTSQKAVTLLKASWKYDCVLRTLMARMKKIMPSFQITALFLSKRPFL